MTKKLWAIALLSAVVFIAASADLYLYSHPAIHRIPYDLQTEDSITFYALGDQGSGGLHQWAVSRAMEKLAEKSHKIDFVVLLGDNFYIKNVLSIFSPEWASKFEEVYSGSYLSAAPFYAVLGNHDPDSTEKDSNIEIEHAKKHLGSNRWRMPGLYYSADFGKVNGRPLLRIVFLDTNLKGEKLLKEADFIRQQFADPTNAPVWKVVAGHHPVRTYGKHYGEGQEKSAILLAAMQDAHVDLYLAGHDHNQQVIARNGEPLQIIDGAGGAKTYPMKKQSPDLRFFRAAHGFVGLSMNAVNLNIDVYDTNPIAVASYKIDRKCTLGQASCLQKRS
jgi:tartrate-resistant acid phosphatase type 5